MKITVEFGGREYTLRTDEPPEVVEKVKKRLEEMLSKYEDDVEDFPREDILFVALANSILQQLQMEEKMERLVERIKEWSYESRPL